MSGCATTNTATQDKAKKEGTALAEAPLGSRIRKKSTINPVAGFNKEEIEQGKVQQNAEHSRAYQ